MQSTPSVYFTFLSSEGFFFGLIYGLLEHFLRFSSPPHAIIISICSHKMLLNQISLSCCRKTLFLQCTSPLFVQFAVNKSGILQFHYKPQCNMIVRSLLIIIFRMTSNPSLISCTQFSLFSLYS